MSNAPPRLLAGTALLVVAACAAPEPPLAPLPRPTVTAPPSDVAPVAVFAPQPVVPVRRPAPEPVYTPLRPSPPVVAPPPPPAPIGAGPGWRPVTE